MFDHSVVKKSEQVRTLLKPLVEVFLQIKSSGKENIPLGGPFILVSNHKSDIDPWAIALTMKRYVSWIGDSYVFDVPVLGYMLKEVGAIPISPQKKDQINAFRRTKATLDAGHIVAMFPEGHDTITKADFERDLGDFHSGFAEYALRFKVPILPVAILTKNAKVEPITIPKLMQIVFNLPDDVANTKFRLSYSKAHVHFGKLIQTNSFQQEYDNIPNDNKPAQKQVVQSLCTYVHDLIEETIHLYKDRFAS